MSESAQFRYAQARLQARHGFRVDDRTWRYLQGYGDLANYLQAAGQTPLHIWTASLHGNSTSHDIELTLREHYRRYVREIAGWLPARWTVVVRSLARLPDLPALQHLLDGYDAPAWMLADPELRPFSSVHHDTRLSALEQSDIAWVVAAWQSESSLPLAWYHHWRKLWPKAPRLTAGLSCLGQLLLRYLREISGAPSTAADRRHAQLQESIIAAFRRYSFQPATACAHIGVIAMDLAILRADLVDRALFTSRHRAQQ